MPFNLDYNELIYLDAEDLAETGIGRAYESLLPKLRQYILRPAEVCEFIDNDTPRYSVECAGRAFVITEPSLELASAMRLFVPQGRPRLAQQFTAG